MTQEQWDSMWKSLDEIHGFYEEESRDMEMVHIINQLMEKLPGDYCEWLALTGQEFYKERNADHELMDFELKQKEMADEGIGISVRNG